MPILRLSFKLWARILWMSLNLIKLISKTKILFIHLEKVESHLKKINKLIQAKLQKEDKTNMIFQIKNVIFKKP
jgi:translation elongation factor EF-1alpha